MQLLEHLDADFRPGLGSSITGGGTQSKSWGKSVASRLMGSSSGSVVSGNSSITAGSNAALAAAAASLASSGGGGGDSSKLHSSGTGSYSGARSGSLLSELNRRKVGPSSSQLYLVRTMLELLQDQSLSSGKHTMRKELDSATLAAVDSFLEQSFYWPYLLNFSGKVDFVCLLVVLSFLCVCTWLFRH